MWQGKNGPCNCYFCEKGVVHPATHEQFVTESRGHLQVAESLDPDDILWTMMCSLCTHEVVRPQSETLDS